MEPKIETVEWKIPERDFTEVMRIQKINDDEVHLFINIFEKELLLGMQMSHIKLLHELLKTFIETGQPEVSLIDPAKETE